MPNLSKQSAPPLLFEIKQSPRLLYLLIITHALAVIASINNGLPWLYQLAALLIVMVSALFYWRDYHHFQSYQIRHSEAFGWQLAQTENDYQTLQILPTTVLTAPLIVLHFRLQSRKTHSLLIINDALNTRDYRALLVGLKISGLQKSQS
ncbi:MAG: hypothetical protein GQ569_08995 [Methylococcaceae bacterium]|nr:hypothetical protein [Methylococcaceae bacterium]